MSSCTFVFTSVLLSSLKRHVFNGLSTCGEQPPGTAGTCFQDEPLWAAVALCDCVPTCADTAGDS